MANARARVFRFTGKFAEAREAFLQAAQDHPYDETIVYSLQGAAEALRDMHRYEDALAEYQQLTESYPLEGHLWAGRASVLMDLGRFEDPGRQLALRSNSRTTSLYNLTASARSPRRL
ncbi:tetratricopeptide repeat protein [Tardiphaga robiniae]|uniref:tetratricopeptide repeat protein n=1 Tax=Tardiphaga robiniae TaxID=943830 RepID=UPI0035B53872